MGQAWDRHTMREGFRLARAYDGDELVGIGVLEGARGRGVGRALLDRLTGGLRQVAGC